MNVTSYSTPHIPISTTGGSGTPFSYTIDGSTFANQTGVMMPTFGVPSTSAGQGSDWYLGFEYDMSFYYNAISSTWSGSIRIYYSWITAGGTFLCPTVIGDDPYFMWYSKPSYTTSSSSIVPKCKTDGSTYRGITLGANAWKTEIGPEFLQSSEIVTPTRYNVSFDVEPAVMDSVENVYLFITDKRILTPSTNAERLAYYLINNAWDYRTIRQGIRGSFQYYPGDVVMAYDATRPYSSFFQCNTADNEGGSGIIYRSSKWDDVTWSAFQFFRDPTTLVDLGYKTISELGATPAHGYISSYIAVPATAQTYNCSVVDPGAYARVSCKLKNTLSTVSNAGSTWVMSKDYETKLCYKEF